MRALASLSSCVATLVALMPSLFGCQSTANSQAKQAATADSVATASAGDAPTTSRYHGYVKLPHRGTRMPAVLDLARVGELPDPTYLGFFRMAAGGFDSHEYVTLYFEDVRFTAETGSLIFAGGPAATRLADVRVTTAGIAGRIVSDVESIDVPFELVPATSGADPAVFPSLPVAGNLTGHYVAACDEFHEVLQLEASRWRGVAAGDTTLFGGYRVDGRKGRFDDVACGDLDKACVADSFAKATAAFLGRTLTLKANQLACNLQGPQIDCGAPCPYVKDTKAPHTVLDVVRNRDPSERAFRLPADDSPTVNPKGHGGQYYGYLHHESRNIYQLIALNVKAAAEVDLQSGEKMSGDRQHVAGVATLYFGQGDSSEFVAYRFKETLASAAGTTLVFDGDGEAVFVVDSWTASTIRGTWYGKSYGRVGTVELARDLVPELTAGSATVPTLSGFYRGEGWEFEMATSANLSEEPSAYYPLKMFGWARERLVSTRRRTIEAGSYDFYTGALAFRLDDGRTVLGLVDDGGFALHWPPVPRLGSPLATADYRTFKKVGESAPQARLQKTP